MASWDIFHADRLELERGQSTQAIRSALARGDLRDDDLVRPAGTTIPWARIADMPELMAPATEPAAHAGPAVQSPQAADTRIETPLPDFEEIQSSLEEIVPPPRVHHPTELPGTSPSDVAFPVLNEPEPHPLHVPGPSAPGASSPAWIWADDDEEEDQGEIVEDREDMEVLADDALDELSRPSNPASEQPRRPDASKAPEHDEDWEPSEADLDLDESNGSQSSSRVALPVVPSRDREGNVIPADAEEPAEAAFSLSRSATQKIEELDLAPMVDVAFQLVLFFMVTATTVLYKTLEIPKPSGETPAGAVAQGHSRTLDELKSDYILVEIDSQGAMKLDREPIEPRRETLVENLRRAREKTGRKAMLVSAEYSTLHRHAVLAYDAAQEIGLSIAVSKPKPPQGPAPTLRAAPATPARSTPKPGDAAAAPL